MSQLFSDVDQRRRNLRIILFIIILATLPFYCAGFWLWGTAPQSNGGSRQTQTPGGVITNTPLEVASPTRTLEASITPLPGPVSPIPFTPATAVLPPTATFPPPIFPTFTPAPTLTPFPTSTPIPPPTNTAIPIPTDTPFPTFTPTLTLTATATWTTIPIDLGAGGDSGVPGGEAPPAP